MKLWELREQTAVLDGDLLVVTPSGHEVSGIEVTQIKGANQGVRGVVIDLDGVDLKPVKRELRDIVARADEIASEAMAIGHQAERLLGDR